VAQKELIKFWKSSGSGVRIRMRTRHTVSGSEQTRLGGGQRFSNALVFIFFSVKIKIALKLWTRFDSVNAHASTRTHRCYLENVILLYIPEHMIKAVNFSRTSRDSQNSRTWATYANFTVFPRSPRIW